MRFSNFLLPFDVFTRHKFVSRFLEKEDEVLDVGGSLSKMEDFSRLKRFKTVDIKEADIVYRGRKIPLEDNYSKTVISLDTLEHIRRQERGNFIKELLRLARDKVIIAAPLGTAVHAGYEKRVLDDLGMKQKKIPPYLKEHVRHGLPTLEEIKNLIPKEYSGKIYFSGNIWLTEKLFRFHLFEWKNPILNRFFYYLKFPVNFFSNLFLYPLLVNRPFGQSVNRFYLVIKK